MPSNLKDKIHNLLHPLTHTSLDTEPNRIAGLEIPRGEGLSKSQRINIALDGLSERQLAELAIRFANEHGDMDLNEAGRKVLDADAPPLTRITRRDVARVFEADLAGDADLLEMVERNFALSHPLDGIFSAGVKSLRDQINENMVRNPGIWSVEDLFREIGALDCSRTRFAGLLQDAIHPLARSGEMQQRTVSALNRVLVRDGYELSPDGQESGHPIYALRQVARGVSGRPKNLIFASRGPKPELGFADAINNDIVVLSGQDSCLIFDRPISPDGLRWSELTAWWSGQVPGGDALSLGRRLQESLASDAEKNVFSTYFKAYRRGLGDRLPALLPQVYLHYDPAIVKTLRNRLPLPRQRMDFLLLMPARQRVVIEVDGKHHFAEGNQASLKVYSEMVSADRELRLAGYEIYRFGANELVGSRAKMVIIDFFDKLFRIHGLTND
ncbi:hypothetical protein [Methylobacterium sp. 88A]|uniref:AbiJ-related protein n=1 Tax=Methylobacterium sp. 88A TaxID=1131813 RepID=UPI00035F7C27|nr:hypothetical protein [Methylobacterium sp. 88A]